MPNQRAQTFKQMSEDVGDAFEAIHECVLALAKADVMTPNAVPRYKNVVPYPWGLAYVVRYRWGGVENINAAQRIVQKCGFNFHPASKYAKDPYRRVGKQRVNESTKLQASFGRLGRDRTGIRFDIIWRCVPQKEPFHEDDPRAKAWDSITKELGEDRLNRVINKLGADKPKGARP